MRVCLVLGLLCLQAVARVDDENCLVQSKRDVVSKPELALEPDSPLMPALHLGLARVQQLAKQLPSPMGTPLGRLPGPLGNLTVEELVAYGVEFLELLKDPTIVGILLEGLHNTSMGLLGISANLLTDAKTLDQAMETAANESQVLKAIEAFLLNLEEGAVQTLANITLDGRKFWDKVPSDNRVKKMLQPVLTVAFNSTKKQVSDTLMSAMTTTNYVILKDRGTFCAIVNPILGNLSEASQFLTQEGSGVTDSYRKAMPRVIPLLEGFAPDVAPTVLQVVNASLDALAELIASAQESVPAASAALSKASYGALHCPRLGVRSGAPLLRARFGIAAALAAAAAWMLAA